MTEGRVARAAPVLGHAVASFFQTVSEEASEEASGVTEGEGGSTGLGEGGGDLGCGGLGGVGGCEGCQEVRGLPCSLLLLCGALCTDSLIAHAKRARRNAWRGGRQQASWACNAQAIKQQSIRQSSSKPSGNRSSRSGEAKDSWKWQLIKRGCKRRGKHWTSKNKNNILCK